MTGMNDRVAQLVVGLPLMAAALGLLLIRRGSPERADLPGSAIPRGTAAAVAVTGGLLTLAAALAQVLGHDGSTSSTVGPLAVGRLEVPLRLLTDSLAAVVALAVAVVALCVQAFAQWYLRADDRYPVFAATVSLFTAAMLLVVQSADLVLLLVGWEVMGWCSFLLIGHDSRRQPARRAAVKAFLVTRIADLAFVIGIVILAVGARSSDLGTVLAYWAPATHGLDFAAEPSHAVRTAAMLCLLSGIAGKSALFPFHDWLPDAMEGPTPASALIHAATMVAAGTYVLARLFAVFAQAGAARLVLAVLCAVTMVGAAALAFAQSDVKRLLAYSTLSQIAIMLSALAVAPAAEGPGAGVFHLVSHAMFKALLFLALGWLGVLAGGTSVARMTGSLRGRRLLGALLGVGFLSLAGVPPLVGFVSKEYVLGSAEESAGSGSAAGVLVLVAVLLTVALTAAYCTRAWLVLTRRPAPGEEDRLARHAVVAPAAEAAVVALAVLTVVGAMVALTPLLEPGAGFNPVTAAASVLLVAGAFAGVRSIARAQPSGDAAARLGASRVAMADSGMDVDRQYVALVATPVLRLAHLVVAADRDVIDAYVRATALGVRWAGAGSERAHGRRPSTYLVWVLLGMLAVGVAGVSLW